MDELKQFLFSHNFGLMIINTTQIGFQLIYVDGSEKILTQEQSWFWRINSHENLQKITTNFSICHLMLFKV